VTNAKVADSTSPLCEWKGYRFDPVDCVDLACVTIAKTEDKCMPVVISSIDDDCGPRRLVKNNGLLYDLIRGCDLTRISWISWSDWHRRSEPVPWDDYAKMFQKDGPTDFVVRFSGPVLKDTIRGDTIVMTVIFVEQGTGWDNTRRVPLSRCDLTPYPADSIPDADKDRLTNQARLTIRPRWWDDEIQPGEDSWMTQREFTVEIEIRGDLILDCHHQAIDGNAIGMRPVPSGNGTPGGTYLSRFRVLPKPLPNADND